MEGLFAVLGIFALAVILVLPICTFVAVRRLGRRMDALESAIREQLRAATRLAAASAHPVVPEPARPVAVPAPDVRLPLPLVTLQPEVKACPVALDVPPPLAMAETVKPVAMPAPVPEPAPLPERQPEVDAAAVRLLRRMWNWLVVGEEFRRPGLSAEFAIATTWLIRAGVVVAVFAVGFGLQLSIARGLLGPAGRVSLALLCGAAFIVAGMRCLCKRYQMLGQGFIGGGLAMFYFAFYAASVMFRLMPVSWSFVCMAAVTASAVVLAVRLEALSIAVLGALGGYLTPVMLKSAHPNLPVLYAYLAVLALGMAGVAVWRRWPLLTWLSLLLNSLLFIGAVGGRCAWHAGQGTLPETLYLCGFFALYSTAVFVYVARNAIPATPVEIAALFLNALVTVGGGTLLIGHGPLQRPYLALLALGIAAFYVGHIWLFLLRRIFDRVLLSGFIALAVIFMGLALPLLFTGQVLSTMFALQAVALLWIGRRLDSRMFTRGALVCYAIVLVRLSLGLLDGSAFAQAEAATYLAGLKDRVVEFVIPILALFGGWRLFRTPPAAAHKGVGDPGMRGSGAYGQTVLLFAVVFYVGLVAYVTRECFSIAFAFLPSARMATVTVVWALFVLHLLTMKARMSESAFRGVLVLAVILVSVQWFFGGWMLGDVPVLEELRHVAAFSLRTALPRLIATLACMAVIVGARGSFSAEEDGAAGLRPLLLCAALIAGFLYLTFETATCCTAYLPGFRAGAVSVAWGCYGLGLLVGGLRFGRRALRMSGLALFFVTVGKVFLVDLAGKDALYRLMGFGMLGGVLLMAAYAYLRNQDAFNKPSDGGQEGA